MRHYIILLLILMIPFVNQAQSTPRDNNGKFGFVLNAGFNGELYALQVAPSIAYSKDINQFEFGIGWNPFDRGDQTLLSGELNYKYFPNGTDQKYNLYLFTQLAFVQNHRDTYYPATYNYLFLTGGYGFQVKLLERAYLGTDIGLGAFSFSKRSENPYDGFSEIAFLTDIEMCLEAQIHICYRF